MGEKLNVAILVGGPSTEHKISLLSGNSIINAMNNEKYNVHVIGIDHDSRWWYYPKGDFLINENSASEISLSNDGVEVSLGKKNGQIILFDNQHDSLSHIDIFFPVLHGHYGEDGIIQGVLQSIGAAYTGAGLMASSVGMDKDLAKRIWREAGIPVADGFVYQRHMKDQIDFEEAEHWLGLPMFVKPANAGSSVGVSKVNDKSSFLKAIDEAFKYDTKVLVEEAIVGKEIECAVLGNENPETSVLGEIIPQAEFYSYEAKYIDKKGAKMAIPAKISESTTKYIRHLAARAFTTIGCEGLARVDFFLTKDSRIVLNEINTLPGFTSISMYPKLWQATGLGYSDLIDKIIELGLARHNRDSGLKKVLS